MNKLPDEQLDSIFRQHILPEVFNKVPSSRKPKAVFVIGNIGAGKSSYVKSCFSPSDCVILELDEFRQHHPDYKHLMSLGEGGKKETGRATIYWRDKLVEMSEKTKKNMVFLPGNFNETVFNQMRLLKQSGYQVELKYILTTPVESEVSVYRRYEKMLEDEIPARMVPWGVRKRSSNSLFTHLNRLTQEGIIDKVEAYTRESFKQPIFTRVFPYTATSIKDETEHKLKSLLSSLKISRPLSLPVLKPETLQTSNSDLFINEREKKELKKLEKQIKYSTFKEASEPAPLTLGDGKSYVIQSVMVSNGVPSLEVKTDKNVTSLATRFHRLDEKGLQAQLNGKLYTQVIPQDSCLLLKNPFTEEEKKLPFVKEKTGFSLKGAEDLVFIRSDKERFLLKNISLDTEVALFEPEEPETSRIITEQDLPPCFEALLKGKVGQGAFSIKKTEKGLIAQHPNSQKEQPITLKDLESSITLFPHDELGTFPVSTLKLFLDKADSRTLPSQLDRKDDKQIGSLTEGIVSLNLPQRDELGKINFLYNFSSKYDAFINTIGLDFKNTKPLYNWFKRRKEDPTVTTHLSTFLSKSTPKREERFKLLNNLGFTIKTPFTASGDEPFIVPHAKILAGKDVDGKNIARLDTSGFIVYDDFMKIDVGLELPEKQASLLLSYLKEKQDFNPDTLELRKKLQELSKSGVLLNDPECQQFMVTRGINQLLREAKNKLNCNIGALNDEAFVGKLIELAKKGVSISVIAHDISKASAEVLYAFFFPKHEISFDKFYKQLTDPKVSCRFNDSNFALIRQERHKNNSEASPLYIHANTIAIDDKKIYVGTAFPWKNMHLNRVLPDGSSFESGFIANGELAQTIIHKLKKIETLMLQNTFEPSISREEIKKKALNLTA